MSATRVLFSRPSSIPSGSVSATRRAEATANGRAAAAASFVPRTSAIPTARSTALWCIPAAAHVSIAVTTNRRQNSGATPGRSWNQSGGGSRSLGGCDSTNRAVRSSRSRSPSSSMGALVAPPSTAAIGDSSTVPERSFSRCSMSRAAATERSRAPPRAPSRASARTPQIGDLASVCMARAAFINRPCAPTLDASSTPRASERMASSAGGGGGGGGASTSSPPSSPPSAVGSSPSAGSGLGSGASPSSSGTSGRPSARTLSSVCSCSTSPTVVCTAACHGELDAITGLAASAAFLLANIGGNFRVSVLAAFSRRSARAIAASLAPSAAAFAASASPFCVSAAAFSSSVASSLASVSSAAAKVSAEDSAAASSAATRASSSSGSAISASSSGGDWYSTGATAVAALNLPSTDSVQPGRSFSKPWATAALAILEKARRYSSCL